MTETKVVGFNVTQANFELSRTVTYMSFEIKNRENLEAIAASSYAVASLSCAFSYAAIESFVNMHIYLTLKEARELKSRSERGECEVPLFDKELAEKYPNDESVRKIIYGQPTKDKIELLCHLKGLKKIHENDPGLWQEFLTLLKEFRDYVIHPKPIPEIYRNMLDGLLVQNKIGSYSSIAERIMTYFYGNLPELTPKWLNKNKYFELKGISIL